MRRVMPATMAVALAVAGCGGSDKPAGDKAAPATDKGGPTRTYFGWVLGASEATGIAIDADPPGKDGVRAIRVYVCDGLGPPRGKAVWFSGEADTEKVNGIGATANLVSAGKRETLDIDHFDDHLVKGTFGDAAGRRLQYVAYPAHDGAGIYEVTLSEDLKYEGTSTDGSKLTAQADEQGLVTGRLTPASGDPVSFALRTLALSSPAELTSRGLSEAYREDADNSVVPGEYVAVIAPRGTHWLGRAGNVRLGSPTAEIIGLDKKEFTTLSRTQISIGDVGAITPP